MSHHDSEEIWQLRAERDAALALLRQKADEVARAEQITAAAKEVVATRAAFDALSERTL